MRHILKISQISLLAASVFSTNLIAQSLTPADVGNRFSRDRVKTFKDMNHQMRILFEPSQRAARYNMMLEGIRLGGGDRVTQYTNGAFRSPLETYDKILQALGIDLQIAGQDTFNENIAPYSAAQYVMGLYNATGSIGDRGVGSVNLKKDFNRNAPLSLSLSDDKQTRSRFAQDRNASTENQATNPIYLSANNPKSRDELSALIAQVNKRQKTELSLSDEGILEIPMSNIIGNPNVQFDPTTNPPQFSVTLQYGEASNPKQLNLQNLNLTKLPRVQGSDGQTSYQMTVANKLQIPLQDFEGHLYFPDEPVVLESTGSALVENQDGSVKVDQIGNLSDEDLQNAKRIHLSIWGLDDFMSHVSKGKINSTGEAAAQSYLKDMLKAAGIKISQANTSTQIPDLVLDLIPQQKCRNEHSLL